MKKVNSLKLNDISFPPQLKEIPQPPQRLFYLGSPFAEWMNKPKVAIVGSRKVTTYGTAVTHDLASALARAGVVIISGLAYGVDSIAHKAALETGGITIAVLPTSVEQIYPAGHLQLSRQIIDTGGTLISEYDKGSEVYKENFIARNRIVSGLADGVLITEAAANSGSMHTARFALEQGKTVMAVPGNINSPTSAGCNNLIKSGAIPVTEIEDIFFALNIRPPELERPKKVFRGSPEEELILGLIQDGTHSQEELASVSRLSVVAVINALTLLEIGGFIRPEGSGNWTTY